MSGLLTDSYDIILAQVAKQYLTSTYKTYVIAGRPFAWDDEDEPDTETGTYEQIADVRSNMIVGIKVQTTDVASVIDRNTWTSNTVYDQYDPRADLEDITFYIINSNDDVYKCLFNNNGIASTIEPTSKSTSPFELADGYIWKYMFTVSESGNTKFGTTEFIPVEANTSVEAAAIRGTIDAYEVEESDITFYTAETGSVVSVVSPLVIKIDSAANSAGNTFAESAFYVTDGTSAGELVKIRSSHANATGKYITLDTTVSLDNTSEYLISPRVVIEGDGEGAKAVCYVSNNTVEKVLTINPGNNYTTATATIQVNPAFDSAATVRPLISPIKGHGANVNIEFLTKKVGLSVSLTPDIHDDLPVGTIYRQVSVLMGATEPNSNTLVEANVVTFATTLGIDGGTFTAGEPITGETSGADGTVYIANSSTLQVINISGAFANNEVVTCESTLESGNVVSVSHRTIDKNSGQVVYYTNNLPINKSNTSSENVRLIINFEG